LRFWRGAAGRLPKKPTRNRRPGGGGADHSVLERKGFSLEQRSSSLLNGIQIPDWQPGAESLLLRAAGERKRRACRESFCGWGFCGGVYSRGESIRRLGDEALQRRTGLIALARRISHSRNNLDTEQATRCRTGNRQELTIIVHERQIGKKARH